MNYRHIYHAGNFADVFKHVVLNLLIQALLNKPKPFCYLDTHAGTGLYDLQQAAAQKTQEFNTGLLPLLRTQKPPELVKPFLAVIQHYNTTAAEDKPRYYPGSPSVVNYFLRERDRMLLNELHAEDVKILSQLFKKNRQAIIYSIDGYQAIKALLPPIERRGLVLIDPTYEQPNEFEQLIKALNEALQRWDTGICAIWYPIKDIYLTNKFLTKIKASINKEILIAEIMLNAGALKTSLNGCGMLIINPPWRLDLQLKEVIPWLWQLLAADKKGGFKIELINSISLSGV